MLALLLCIVQSLSHVWLFATSWTATRQASLSFTISQSLLKLISIESVMLCNPMDCSPPGCPWNSPAKNTGVGCHSLLNGIFPTQWLSPGHPHCRQILYHLSYQGSLILWPPDAKSRLIGKDSEAGKDQEQEKKVTEGEMVDSINGHEFEQTLGDSEGEGSLVCCRVHGVKELDTTEWLNNNNNPKL